MFAYTLVSAVTVQYVYNSCHLNSCNTRGVGCTYSIYLYSFIFLNLFLNYFAQISLLIQCNVFVEEAEELLEEWWSNLDRDNDDFERWLCIEKALGKRLFHRSSSHMQW